VECAELVEAHGSMAAAFRNLFKPARRLKPRVTRYEAGLRWRI
jgi:hypothetical protein